MKSKNKNQLPFTYAYKTEAGKAAVLQSYDAILAHWPVPYEELSIATDYGNTYLIRSGEINQPALLLLHGTSSNSSMWIADVARYSEHFCVYAVDIPGEPGKSEERQYPLAASVYPDWLNQLITNLGLQEVFIVGISLGAWLATGFAVRYPGNVKKLALLCPSGIGRQRASFLFKALFYMFLGEKGYDRLTDLVNGGQPIPEKAKEYTRQISKAFNLRQESVPIYTDDELLRLKMPVLVYAGEKDILLNSEETITRISKLLPHAKAKLLPGYGHVLIGFKDEIAKFLIS